MKHLICIFKGHVWEYFSQMLPSGRCPKIKHCTRCGRIRRAKMVEYIIGTARQTK